MPRYPPKIPHRLVWDWTWDSKVSADHWSFSFSLLLFPPS